MVGEQSRRAGPGNRAFRKSLIVIAATMAMMMPGQSGAEQPQKIVELFTSQGCSSCPPADRLAERFVEEDTDLLTLVMPVDYWDYLGWKDTLATPANSQRQRAYAAHRGDRSVYTPQMVVNGDEHVIGSHEDEVRAALRRTDPFTATVDLNISDMVVEARVDGSLPRSARMATVYFLGIQDRATVEIPRGENAGRSITYVNVVRNLQPIGMWSGGPETFRMPKSKLMLKGDARCAVLIQVEDQEGLGPVIGAAVLNLRDRAVKGAAAD